MNHPEGHAQAPESTERDAEPVKAPAATPTATDATEADSARLTRYAEAILTATWPNGSHPSPRAAQIVAPVVIAIADQEQATLRAENEALRLEVGDWINDQADKVARLADAEAEIERLRRWKAEATEVILGLQDLGDALGIPLGERITGPAAVEAAQALRKRVADAWDEGYVAGHSNAMRRMSDEPNAPTSPNPHRAALADAPTEATPPAEQQAEGGA